MIPVVVPYAQLHPETRAALEGVEGVTFVDVSDGPGEEASRYFWLLQAAWHRQEGVIIVEQDIVPPPGAIDELRACPQDWCGRPYQVGINIDCWLGLTKFSPAIMAAVPDAFDRMERTAYDSLDGQLLPYLWQRGYHACKHWPAVDHKHDCGDPSRVLTSCPCGGPIRFEQMRLGPNEVLCPKCGSYVNAFPLG